ncbi:MAG: hypothetical protein JSS98_06025 [Bacteroidetes bacterium]|nr:hypothetical protein [Bacteroidota bacterium]
MGTDLVSIGNHKIKFRGRDFKDIANEITERLNKIIFDNAEYLRVYALSCQNGTPKGVRTIRKIKTKKGWTLL